VAEKTISEAKVEKVKFLQAKFAGAQAAVLSDYCGLNVQEMSELRGMLRKADVELHVVKNTLARRAVESTHLKPLAEYVKGPIAVALTIDDAVGMAKVLTNYTKKEPKLDVRVGIVEGRVLTAEQLTQVAELPPREVLLAQMLGAMQNPLSGLAGVLHGVLRQLLYALVAIKEAKGQSGD
jgi:large subunit ribosomal protein L10